MKKIYFLLLIIFSLLLSNVHANNINLNDIENHWAKENIIEMIINENVSGYEDNTFKPDKEVTTLEFIKMVFNAMNIKLIEDGLNEWPDYYIATAQKYELNYDYNKVITRNEAVEIISKLIDLKGISTSNNKFKDLDTKYRNNILKLSKLKIINGYEDNTFRGENSLTRAEAVTIILRTVEKNEEIISDKKYKLKEEYTNINVNPTQKSEIDKIRYEIKNNKIHFYDSGRFSNVQDYVIEEKYVTNKKLINLMENLVTENTYTSLYYVPSKYVINQIIIKHGENDNLVSKGLDYFSFTYYEDKLYDLNRITLKDEFTHECYLKIDIKKLWKELYEFENLEFVNEHIKEKLYNSLKIEFGKNADEILEYMLQKYNQNMNNEYLGNTIIEKVQIGNIIINCYKTDATSLEFYFEKLSS